MLKTVWLTEQRDMRKGTAMLLGGFDGLHLGHRYLLARAKSHALPVGLMTIVDGKSDGNLFTFSERERIFLRSGADFVFELPFAEIKDLTPTEFIDLLCNEFSPKVFVCGEDFRFGTKASGTPETLKTYGHVRVESYPLIQYDGIKVSATAVKHHLSIGEIERANELLGEEFFLLGEVVRDRQVGRKMGFPTANIVYPKEKYPIRKGVYETRVLLDGNVYKGITNYGARPTFDDRTVLTETYLDGFQGDLYGKTLCVQFVRYLRDIQKFDDANALKAQLEEDIRRVRNGD